ncbi:MAG: hypothetical protein AB1457_05810 [Chloroflexota bacterium]|nr:MAG: hypothetical protein KatS3mg045_1060 [Bellilinea sp.]
MDDIGRMGELLLSQRYRFLSPLRLKDFDVGENDKKRNLRKKIKKFNL